MTKDISDEKLALNLGARLDLVQQAYATGDAEKIDHALLTVIDVRRMVSTGMREWLNVGED